MADFLTDSLTGANGTDLAAHTPDVGGTWTEATANTLAIQGNTLWGPTSAFADAQNAATPASADYRVAADLVMSSSGYGNKAGVMGRIDSGVSNGYIAYWDDAAGLWYCYKVLGGSFTLLGSSATPAFYSGTKRIRLAMVGTAITVDVDGSTIVTATDSGISAANRAGVISNGGLAGSIAIDNISAGPVTSSLVHVVSGRGSFAITGLEWLKTTITGRPGIVTCGAAEPPNWYHVGMLSWASSNGAMVAYPVTRDADLVQLPPNMTTLYYEFVTGVTATITELSAP